MVLSAKYPFKIFLVQRSYGKLYLIKRSSSWTSNRIRSSFLSFFQAHSHEFIPSSPVIPWTDSSLEFVNAGMNQFKSTLLGLKPRPTRRAVNSQKCIRVGGKHNDLSCVGRDTYHHTFFEMLGNWSFNDYFKEEACRMSWNLLTEVYGIPEQNLYVTYFEGNESLNLKPDEEVKEIWLSLGVPKNRVLPFGMKDNFWEMGEIGPCGPCSEIHYERAPSLNGASRVNRGYEDLIEIWNIVFIQYQRMENGSLLPLNSHYVDTGMGLERITACLNNKLSNYDTDLFLPLFDVIQKISGKPPYSGKFVAAGEPCLDTSYRILADHSRMIAISLADGLQPHDNYILHKTIRRCLMIGWEDFGLKSFPNFLSLLVESVTSSLGDVYSELERNYEQSKAILEGEEEKFIDMQSKISRDWPLLLEKYPNLGCMTNVSMKLIEAIKNILPYIDKWRGEFPPEEAARLVNSYFLRLEMIKEIADAFNLNVKENIVQKILDDSPKGQRNLKEFINHYDELPSLVRHLKSKSICHTDISPVYQYTINDKGYNYPVHSSCIACLFSNNGFVSKLIENQEGYIVLNSTNFYPRSGGQSSDNGVMSSGDSVFKVIQVYIVDGFVFHYGIVQKGGFDEGQDVYLSINKNFRLGASKSHTVHHLMMAAIKSVTKSAFQRSSNVNDKGFTLDVYSYPPLEFTELQQAEQIVKEWILKDELVSRKTKSIFEALQEDKPNLISGEKYPEDVHVVTSDFDCSLSSSLPFGSHLGVIKSVELCCGTHLFSTGNIEDFVVTEFKKVGRDINRISGIHGKEATKRLRNMEALMQAFSSWANKITTALENNERLFELNRDFKKWKTTLVKSQLPLLAYEEVIASSDELLKKMEAVLLPGSNWLEIEKEFRHFLSNDGAKIIVYCTKTDYRGSLDNLYNIMKDINLQNRLGVALICKGWGRIRVCFYISEVENKGVILEEILSELKCTFPEATGKIVGQILGGLGAFHLPGVKANKIELIRGQITEICSKHFAKL